MQVMHCMRVISSTLYQYYKRNILGCIYTRSSLARAWKSVKYVLNDNVLTRENTAMEFKRLIRLYFFFFSIKYNCSRVKHTTRKIIGISHNNRVHARKTL